MKVKFKIFCKDSKKVSENLISDNDTIHSSQIRYSIFVQEVSKGEVSGVISFDPSYQPTDTILKDKADQTIKSLLYAYSFVSKDSYYLDLEV